MGKGIDLGREQAPELAAALDDMKDQLLIVLIRRLADSNGDLLIPIKEVDSTGDSVLEFRVDARLKNLRFHVFKKS